MGFQYAPQTWEPYKHSIRIAAVSLAALCVIASEVHASDLCSGFSGNVTATRGANCPAGKACIHGTLTGTFAGRYFLKVCTPAR